ncbi:MAG: hypothetical protein RL764_545 [Pseudomonadota bacterium]
MAIALAFINLIIRIDAIEAKYQGWWEKFKRDHEMQIGSVAWYEDHLFRIGAMSPADLEPWVEDFRAAGLRLWQEANGDTRRLQPGEMEALEQAI